jgi:hypothetical protein
VGWQEDEDSDGVGQEQHGDLENVGQEHHEDLEGSGQEHHSSFVDDEGGEGVGLLQAQQPNTTSSGGATWSSLL